MNTNRFELLHPEGKQGGTIDRQKYETMKTAILACVQAHGEISFTELVDQIKEQIGDTFDGSIPWYVTTVKLDLEARGILERFKKNQRQCIRVRG
ncbi:DUF6958 family protein [Marinicrinis sediminis]|uniref:DUF6958 family protein n=1 Tax=Marinicrinis sediminis TaxID=1652465 RepID=A0ABW5R800_9BACL